MSFQVLLLGAEGEEIKASQIIVLGGLSRGPGLGCRLMLLQYCLGRGDSPKAETKSFPNLCAKVAEGAPGEALNAFGTVNSPLLQYLLSDIGIVTQPDVSRIVF